jgi:sialate O-acetylesterase
VKRIPSPALAGALLALACHAHAELSVSSVIADHMVLQQGRPASIWGSDAPGTKVTVEFAGQSRSAVAGPGGAWLVRLDPMPASAASRVLVVTGSSKKQFQDVLVGEVWICSGQSNMGHPVSKCANVAVELANALDPELRLTGVPLQLGQQPFESLRPGMAWRIADARSVEGYAAVPYQFGKSLRRKLGIPVGIVGAWMGGMPIETWIPWEAQSSDPAAIAQRKEMYDQAARFDPAAEQKAFDERKAKFEKDMLDWKKGDEVGAMPFLRPLAPHPLQHPRFPSQLYNGTIFPLRHFPIRGVAWYQGESNTLTAAAATHYAEQLRTLIASWRKDWGCPIPFVVAQLPFFRAPAREPVERDTRWPLLRESILKVSQDTPAVGMAVLIDTGDIDEVHPRLKAVVGERLANVAMRVAYGKDNLVWTGPTPLRCTRVTGGYEVEFETGGAPLMVKGGGPLTGFAIEKKTGEISRTQAKLTSRRTVRIESSGAGDRMLYYAWAMNPAGANLFNEGDLPASPFRFSVER